MRLEAALLNMHIYVQIYIQNLYQNVSSGFQIASWVPEVKFQNHILGRICLLLILEICDVRVRS